MRTRLSAIGFLLLANVISLRAEKVRIVLVGDSTVTDKAGWGLGFKRFLTDQVECTNVSAGGRSSKSFINEGRWTNALALKGDYYLIQFGHNDEPGKGERSTDPETTYREFMKRYVDDARAIGAKPILVTSLVRRQWDKSGNGKINSSLTPYANVVKALAKEKQVPLIDLHARSKALCEEWGEERCLAFSPPKGTNEIDHTHLNATGSVIFARLVVEELVRVAPELKSSFRSEPIAESTNETPKVFDVHEFGAKGDGKTLDTAAIQAALDACGKAGGGIVRLTAGVYLSKPIFLRCNTTLQLDEGAILQATDDPADFQNLGFVNGDTLTGVAITGKGTIDGAGARWWTPVKEAKKAGKPEPQRRPRMVLLNKCVGVRIEDVTLRNSPSFHLVPRDCEDVDVTGVTILAPADSPNTDAIDPSASRHVRISKCVIDVGDDNIAIKSGHADSAHPNAACEDITITDCTFLHGHGMSIGSETVGGVRDLTVQHCTFENTTSGLRIKSDRSRGGLVENLTYTDITMKNVKIPINITAYYPRIPKEDSVQPITGRTPIYRNIRIKNVTATSPQSAGFIVGLPECVISNIVLENVHITTPKGMTVRHATAIKLSNSSIPIILETNATVESDVKADLTVAPDGTGDFTTVQAAIQSIPRNNRERMIVYIKDGVYHEKVRVDPDFVTLRGESRGGTRIEFAQGTDEFNRQPDDLGRAVVNINGNDFVMENLTVKNTHGVVGPHAFAVYGKGDRTVIVDCDILSDGADTLALWGERSGSYQARLNIRGSVDFVCPRGWCYMSDCTFYEVNPAAHAAIWHDGSKDKDMKFVLRNCRFDGVNNWILARHHRDAQFFLLDCTFSKAMRDLPPRRVVYPIEGDKPSEGDAKKNRDLDASNQWGERAYFYNCHRDGGDYDWHRDNLPVTPSQVTAAWTFAGKWDPERRAGPTIQKADGLTLVFNENVTVKGKPRLVLKSGGFANYASGSGSDTLVFTGKSSTGTSVDLNGGNIFATAAAATLRVADLTIPR